MTARAQRLTVALVLFGPGGCSDDDGAASGTGSGCDEPGYADRVIAFDPTEGATYNHELMPDVVLGPPGAKMADVVPLGCAGEIELAFDGAIFDGPGPDFIVFENAFQIAGADTTFAEPAVVSVSLGGDEWFAFECDLSGDESWPPTGCAGWNPVRADGAESPDPESYGGDPFDLADVGIDRIDRLRLRDVTVEYYGTMKWCGGGTGGFDLDAAGAIHRECE